MSSFDGAVHVLGVVGWMVLLIGGGLLGLWIAVMALGPILSLGKATSWSDVRPFFRRLLYLTYAGVAIAGAWATLGESPAPPSRPSASHHQSP